MKLIFIQYNVIPKRQTYQRFKNFKTKVTAKAGGKSHDSGKISEDLKVANTNPLVLKWVKRQTRKLD